ncbi:MAG: hypothetical protein RL551_860, partial [Pseudomonadota bacterium]
QRREDREQVEQERALERIRIPHHDRWLDHAQLLQRRAPGGLAGAHFHERLHAPGPAEHVDLALVQAREQVVPLAEGQVSDAPAHGRATSQPRRRRRAHVH